MNLYTSLECDDMILILGATGFVGKEMCRKLRETGRRFVGLGHEDCELRDMVQVKAAFEKYRPEIVINLAVFLGGVHFGIKHAAEMFTNNMQMQLNILEACRIYHVKRLINPIGSCVYPGALEVYVEEKLWDGPIHDSVLPFATAKKAFVVACEAYRRQYGLDSVNLVMSNMYGPSDHFDEERAHAVGGLIKKMLDAKYQGKEIVTVLGTGKPVREWLFIRDAVEALYMALDMEPYVGVLNIGAQKGYSIRETAELIKGIVGYKGELVYDTSAPDGALIKTVDGTKAQRLLGWKPSVSFEDGLKETVRWFEETYYVR